MRGKSYCFLDLHKVSLLGTHRQGADNLVVVVDVDDNVVSKEEGTKKQKRRKIMAAWNFNLDPT